VTVGILGGGQLAHFLCVAARQLGVRSVVLDAKPDCPAARSADRVIAGALDDLAAAAELADLCDVVTFDVETVSPEVLKYLGGRAADGRVRVAPGAAAMLMLQNKGLQKQWLVRQGMPTPAFVQLAGGPIDQQALVARFGLPLVQKSATGGFDGRGVQIIGDESALDRLWESPSIVEAFVPDAEEIAVLAARGLDGALAFYGPIGLTMDPDDNVLTTAVAPAPVSDGVAREARRLAADIVAGLDTIGLFAVEMFVTPEGRVLVNEISPRVHNAGHYTLEACETSQFMQHMRAILGLPLGSARQRVPAAVMHNLLLRPGLDSLCEVGGFDRMDVRTGTAIHWYGKSGGAPGRKMGHVTALGSDPGAAGRRAGAAVRAVSTIGLETFA
jgi:5-(carboxyamino)imidazole ribonucleotide synthase